MHLVVGRQRYLGPEQDPEHPDVHEQTQRVRYSVARMPEYFKEHLRDRERHARFLGFLRRLDASQFRLVDGPLGLLQGRDLPSASRQLQIRESTIYNTDEQERDQKRATSSKHEEEQRHRDGRLRLVVPERADRLRVHALQDQLVPIIKGEHGERRTDSLPKIIKVVEGLFYFERFHGVHDFA